MTKAQEHSKEMELPALAEVKALALKYRELKCLVDAAKEANKHAPDDLRLPEEMITLLESK